jgi:indole-3-glycerol phosphate synthase/phosphoribosylanthranilate isomerase
LLEFEPGTTMSAETKSGTVLDRIIEARRAAIAHRKKTVPETALRFGVKHGKPVRDFAAALTRDSLNVIAELKKASPSAGLIRKDFDPVALAKQFETAGAAALSVLTEEEFFQGELKFLRDARAAVSVPALRKDFIVDPWQVWEARATDADSFLLIVAALSDSLLGELLALGRELGMEPVVEVHTREDLARALAAGSRIIGVNNRDLKTLEVRIETSAELIQSIPDECIAVCESGLRTHADLVRLREAGFDAFLIGEHLMARPDPGAAPRPIQGGEPAMRTRVKICGITTWEDARLSVDLGASALGFNFYPASPRAVSPADAWGIIRRLPPFVEAVGVFVDWPPLAVDALARALRLGAVQLHGMESPADVAALARRHRVIKALAVKPGFRPASIARYRAADAILLDGFARGLHGGTGRTLDWKLARAASRFARIVLAGGLVPENVAEAVRIARPYAVDVASGVEAKLGRKDHAKLRAFFAEIEKAER